MPCANNINLDRPSLHKYKPFHLSACKTVLIKYARENANPSADKMERYCLLELHLSAKRGKENYPYLLREQEI